MRKILIFGANSAIAQAVARRFAQRGHIMYLVGRDPVKLAAIAADLRVRTKATIYTRSADLDVQDQHKNLIEDAKQAMAGLDTVLIAHGLLGQQQLAQGSIDQTMAIIKTNLLSPISILTHAAAEFASHWDKPVPVVEAGPWPNIDIAHFRKVFGLDLSWIDPAKIGPGVLYSTKGFPSHTPVIFIDEGGATLYFVMSD